MKHHLAEFDSAIDYPNHWRRVDMTFAVLYVRAFWSSLLPSPAKKVVRFGKSIAQRFNLLLLGLMAGVALILAAVGLYGVTAYSVEQRTREIGIRVAVGAKPRHVISMVLLHGVKLAVVGTALGILCAFSLAGLMKGLLFGVPARDPLTYVLVRSLLSLVTLAACYVPARSALRIDPISALRHE